MLQKFCYGKKIHFRFLSEVKIGNVSLFKKEKKDCRSFTIIPLFEIKQQILPPFSERAIFCPQAFTEKTILGFKKVSLRI